MNSDLYQKLLIKELFTPPWGKKKTLRLMSFYTTQSRSLTCVSIKIPLLFVKWDLLSNNHS